jgi:hypothetical protein
MSRWIAALMLLAVVVPARGDEGENKGPQTPQACFEAVRKATVEKDGKALWALLGPAPRKQMDEQVAQIKQMVQFAGDAEKAMLGEQLKELGLTIDDVANLTGEQFFTKVFSTKIPDHVIIEAKNSRYESETIEGEATEDGAKAVVKIKVTQEDGSEKDDDMKFVRDGGSWKIASMGDE